MNWAKISFIALLLVILTLLAIEGCQERLYIKAIVGEASSEDYTGMYAIACALRNRGTLEGVYGLDAPHVKSESLKVWKTARKAYRASQKGIDVTFGATHFESTDFEAPYWANKMKFTIRIGKHRFYK